MIRGRLYREYASFVREYFMAFLYVYYQLVFITTGLFVQYLYVIYTLGYLSLSMFIIQSMNNLLRNLVEQTKYNQCIFHKAHIRLYNVVDKNWQG